MKTNLFKKANESKKAELIEMKSDELKSIQGGGMVMIRHDDGSIVLIFTRV